MVSPIQRVGRPREAVEHGDFSVDELNLGCRAVRHRGRTVAVVTPQGFVDWLIHRLDQEDVLLESVYKETHMEHILGFKFNLHLPHCTTVMDEVSMPSQNGDEFEIQARSHSSDGRFKGFHSATLGVDAERGEYVWSLATRLLCAAEAPVELDWIEFNNVVPAMTGNCMLYAPRKRYDRTLIVDRDGAVWEFPHQHAMHYGSAGKFQPLRFSPGAVAGFFGEAYNPVVIVDESPLEPDWRICDMYYDLHCGARPNGPMMPGACYTWRYRIRHLDAEESRSLLEKARRIPVTSEDRRRFLCARFELGHNDFRRPVRIDAQDEASGFYPQPPSKIWEPSGGPEGQGVLRLVNDAAGELVWSPCPPAPVPPGSTLVVSARVRTRGVEGKGCFIRVRPQMFQWRPKPHVERDAPLESAAAAGSTEWTELSVPPLRVPSDRLDCGVWFDIVLDGRGEALVTDMTVELK